jgi:hypothetical protein
VDPGRCFIHVRLRLVRGWRTTVLVGSTAAEPVDVTSVRR